MAHNTPKVDEIVEQLDDTGTDRALLKVAAILGSQPRWNADTLMDIATFLDDTLARTDAPSVSSTSSDDIERWQDIADELGLL